MMLPTGGKGFVTVAEPDKEGVLAPARMLHELGFRITATGAPPHFLTRPDIPADPVLKITEGRPHIADLIKNGEIALVINTPLGAQSKADSYYIRRTALVSNIPYGTQLSAPGIRTPRDALFFFPKGYEDRRRIVSLRSATPGRIVPVKGQILAVRGGGRGWGGRRFLEVVISDGTGRLSAKWFHFRPSLADRVPVGGTVALGGMVGLLQL